MEYTTLNDGNRMPMFGFGVFQVPDPAQCEQAVTWALDAGYRLLDTAAAYMNEEAVGRAIAQSGVTRDDLFVTTKLWTQDQGYDAAKRAVDVSLAKLGLDYLDLYLIHQPVGDYYGSWRAMEELHREGALRSIGVPNFRPDRLQDLVDHNDVVPAVNQVEINPWFRQVKVVPFMESLGVRPEAWGPFAEGNHDIFHNPVLTEIAEAHGKGVGQVILRWQLQRGVVAIPKSVRKERIEENFDIFDFELTDDDMDRIAALERGHSEIVNHDDPAFIHMIGTMKIHE